MTEVRPLWNYVTVQNGYAFDSQLFSDTGDIPLARIRDILSSEFETFISRETVPSDDYVIQDGDLVIGMDGDFNSVIWERGEAALNQRVCVVRPHENANIRFVHYAMMKPLKTVNDLRYSTTVKHLSQDDIYSMRVPLPDLAGQQRIADYLDRETAEIDAAVADLDKYMKLLRLRARKLINEQLMSGYPEVKMGLLAESIIGLTYRPENVVDEGGIYVYRSGNVQESKIDRSNMLAVDVEVPPHLRFKRGDILMCSRNGSANLVGKNAIVDPCDYGQTWGAFMTVIRSDLNRYLYWFFRSPRFDDYRGSFSSSTINQLTTGILNRIPVPLPPENKRDEITAFLEEEVSKIDSLIEESTKLRDLLLKRRSVLITEVVTGRKQV